MNNKIPFSDLPSFIRENVGNNPLCGDIVICSSEEMYGRLEVLQRYHFLGKMSERLSIYDNAEDAEYNALNDAVINLRRLVHPLVVSAFGRDSQVQLKIFRPESM